MLISHLPACMQFKQTTIGVKPAPIMASYASRGPSRYFPNILKLYIIRSLVLAASSPRSTTAHIAISNMPVNDAYILSSGTSFAFPHVAAGLAVLLKSAHLEWSAAVLKTRW